MDKGCSTDNFAYLEVTRAGDINDGKCVFGSVSEGLLGHQREKAIDVDGGLVVLVLLVVEVAHTNLTNVSRVAREREHDQFFR